MPPWVPSGIPARDMGRLPRYAHSFKPPRRRRQTEGWASDSVQPQPGDVVDVLYHVRGKHAYFRGTVTRARRTAQLLTLTINFNHQSHYGLTFPTETTAVTWKAGVVRVVVSV